MRLATSERAMDFAGEVPPRAFPPATLLSGALLGAITMVYLTLSSLALVAIGFNYEDTGGSIIEKVHPATWLTVIALGLAAMQERNPLTSALAALGNFPRTLAFVGCTLLFIAHVVAFVGLPFTPFIDTFLAPVLVFFLFKNLGERRRYRLALLVHALLALNALIGLGEFATGLRLTPIIAGGVPIDDDWRSSALLGHPLANASLTGAYLIALVVGGGYDLPRPVRYLAFSLSLAGMVVFGGRASTVILLLLLAVILMVRSGRVIGGAKFGTDGIVRALILLPVAAALLVGVNEFGFFDRFIERFADDRGSADTRVEMFELFRLVGAYELWLVPDPAHIGTLQRAYGLDFGIESFWVSFVLNYGVLMSSVLFIGLFLFCADVVAATERGAIWVLVFFFLVASTSLSLSAKTTIFAVLILMTLVLLGARGKAR